MYAELAVTTNFSFLRGASHPEELVARARRLGLAGIGIADRNSVAGVVRAHMAAQAAGLRLAIGARLVFADGTPDMLAFPRDRPPGEGSPACSRAASAGPKKAIASSISMISSISSPASTSSSWRRRVSMPRPCRRC